MDRNAYVEEVGKNLCKAYNKAIESVDNAMNNINNSFGDNACSCGDGGNGNCRYRLSHFDEVIEKLNERTTKMMKERAGTPLIIPPIQFINVKGKWKPHIIFNGAATIVFWCDGTKTVVKCKEGTEYNVEEGLRWCIIKKLLGDSPEFWNFIKGAVPEDKANKNKYCVWAKKMIAQAKHINKDLNA